MYIKNIDTNQVLFSVKKLELCAFALKGEHNVYSIVPNITVYIYIYWPKVNVYQVVVGQESVRTLFKSLAQLFL